MARHGAGQRVFQRGGGRAQVAVQRQALEEGGVGAQVGPAQIAILLVLLVEQPEAVQGQFQFGQVINLRQQFGKERVGDDDRAQFFGKADEAGGWTHGMRMRAIGSPAV